MSSRDRSSEDASDYLKKDEYEGLTKSWSKLFEGPTRGSVSPRDRSSEDASDYLEMDFDEGSTNSWSKLFEDPTRRSMSSQDASSEDASDYLEEGEYGRLAEFEFQRFEEYLRLLEKDREPQLPLEREQRTSVGVASAGKRLKKRYDILKAAKGATLRPRSSQDHSLQVASNYLGKGENEGLTELQSQWHEEIQRLTEKILELELFLKREQRNFLKLSKKNQDNEKALEEHKKEISMLNRRVYQLEETMLRDRNGKTSGSTEEDAAKRASEEGTGDWAPREDTGDEVPGEGTGDGGPREDTGEGAPGEGAGDEAPEKGSGDGASGKGTADRASEESTGDRASGERTGGGAPGEDAGDQAPEKVAGDGAPEEGTGDKAPGEGAGDGAPGKGTDDGAPGKGTDDGASREGADEGGPGGSTGDGAPKEGAADRALEGPTDGATEGSAKECRERVDNAYDVDEDSLDSDSDYDDHPIPDALKAELKELCEERGVEKFVFHQNPDDDQHVQIEGIGAADIPDADLSAVEERWKGHKICKKEFEEEEIEQCAPALIEGVSTAPLKGMCQLVVEKPSDGMMKTYAVGAAHILFSEETNRQLRRGIGIEQAQEHIQRTPPHTVYRIKCEAGELVIIEAQGSPMFFYRYRTNSEELEEVADILPQPANPKDSERKVDPKECLNDLVLFCLKYSDGEKMAQWLNPNQKICKMVRVDHYKALKKYVRPSNQIKIIVKGCEGKLKRHSLDIDQQRMKGNAIHLRFVLHNGTLEKGDSGSIVYKVNRDESLSPLGLFTGILQQRFSGSQKLYQAVILSPALQEFSRDFQVFNQSFIDRDENGRILPPNQMDIE